MLVWVVFRCQCTNSEVFVAWILQMVLKWKACLWKVLQFLYFWIFFQHGWGFDFSPACSRHKRVSDHGTTSEDYTTVENVKTGFASSKFPTVLTLTMFFFRFTMFWSYSSYCRSISAKPADRRSPQQRTSQVRQAEIRTVPILNLRPKLSN